MIFDYTEQDRKEINEIEVKYDKLLKEARAIIDSRTDAPTWDYENGTLKDTQKYQEWEEAGSKEWKEARINFRKLNEALYKERTALYDKIEKEHFDEFKNDLPAILEDAKNQVNQVLYNLFQFINNNEGNTNSEKIKNKEAIARIKGSLHLHIEALAANQELHNELENYIYNTVRYSDYTTLEEDTENESELERVISVLPKSYIMPNTKLVNEITKNFMNNGIQQIETNNKHSAIIYASLSFDDENVKLPKNYLAYDREVLNAVCSLAEAGNNFIWPEQVHRTLAGQTDSEYVSAQAVQEVTKSLDKQMFSKVIIDFTNQAQAYKSKNIKNPKIEGNMLYMVKCTCLVNGAERTGYKLLAKPILYEYSQHIGQVITVDMRYLDTKSVVRNTQDNIIMKTYLLRRIEEMINPKTVTSNKIRYETIFKECQIDASDKTQRKRYRESIKKFLEFWKSEGLIKGYKEEKDARTFVGISIQY